MQSHYAPPGRLTSQQAATLLGITTTNLRVIVHRGQLKRAGGTRYRPQYALEDVNALSIARAANHGTQGPPAQPVKSA
ncbi:hypothetical protein ACFW91_24985 [Streptomyces asoensis]|uniref:hypothetical protein n=1 Tax=Streptomyces asoensis TaxID=249586 RepID=UPI0036A3D48C